MSKQLEQGKDIIRKEGTNFSVFKRKVSHVLAGAEYLTEDDWVRYYNDYALLRAHYCESVTQWTRDHFEGFKPDTHDTYLKSKKTTMNKIHTFLLTTILTLFPGAKKPLARAMNINDVMRKKFKGVDLGPYTGILGEIENKATLFAYGHSGSGKSVWILQLVNFLAGVFGKVLYNSHEEKINKTVQSRIARFISKPHIKVHFAPGWDFDTLMEKVQKNKYRVVVIDSVQYAKFSYGQLQKFRDVFKKKGIILILISFGKGQTQLSGELQKLWHASDVKLWFCKGQMVSTSRYMGEPKVVQLFTPTKSQMELFDKELAEAELIAMNEATETVGKAPKRGFKKKESPATEPVKQDELPNLN